MQLFISSIGSADTFFLLYTALTALLIGINVALFIFYLRLYRVAPSVKNMSSGVFGSLFALLGFGCVSCGSIFFTTLFAAASGAGLIATTPYLGIGLGVLGIILLMLSSFFLVRTINTPPVCPI